jgi:hypothetical protein
VFENPRLLARLELVHAQSLADYLAAGRVAAAVHLLLQVLLLRRVNVEAGFHCHLATIPQSGRWCQRESRLPSKLRATSSQAGGKLIYASALRRVVTDRDLAEYAHGGSPGFWGASQLLGAALTAGGFGAPFSPTNPYLKLRASNHGAASFGLAAIQAYIPLAASREMPSRTLVTDRKRDAQSSRGVEHACVVAGQRSGDALAPEELE